jgi:hypothetical protein
VDRFCNVLKSEPFSQLEFQSGLFLQLDLFMPGAFFRRCMCRYLLFFVGERVRCHFYWWVGSCRTCIMHTVIFYSWVCSWSDVHTLFCFGRCWRATPWPWELATTASEAFDTEGKNVCNTQIQRRWCPTVEVRVWGEGISRRRP